jgi:DNA mismatch repair protein MLH3
MFYKNYAALASAADVSCLEIASRTSISQETWSVITKVHASLPSFLLVLFNVLQNGRCLYNGPSARWRLERPGTVVYLRDIFHNVCVCQNLWLLLGGV